MEDLPLKTGKYHLGRYADPGDFRGWVIGSFFPEGHPCKTDKIELFYKEHAPGDIVKPHYHRKKIELIIMVDGLAVYNINGQDVKLESGSFLFIDVNNIISGKYLKHSKIFAIHSPSLPEDKILERGT